MNLKLCASLVKMLQEPGTMWLVLICDFVTVPWECSAPCWEWLWKFFEVHELSISLDHHLRTSFVVSLHSLGHSGGRKFEWKIRLFYRFFSIFLKVLVKKRNFKFSAPNLLKNLLALPQHQHTSFLCPDVSDKIALSFFKELLNKRTVTKSSRLRNEKRNEIKNKVQFGKMTK